MKKRNLLLMLLLAIGLPWAANAQDLADYTFSTGTDATKWVTLTQSATSLLTYTSYTDSKASDVTNIGFSFPFGESTYTQFSVNTDGNLRLGNTVTGTSQYTTPFSSSNANVNNPKINALGCDGALNVSGHYVKSELVGNDKLVVEFSEGTWDSGTRSELYKWQIQLYSNGDIEIVFPDASELPGTNPAVAHQCGLCVNSTDGWVIKLSDNTAEHFTNGSTTTNASGTWFDANRYYRFVRPVIAYPKPTNLQATGTDHESASFSWTAPEQGPNTLTGYAYQYKKASDTDWPTSWTSGVNASATTLTIHGLEASTSYNFRFKALYGSNESDIVTADFSTTAQATAVGDSWSDDFEGTECGWELINGSQTNQWVWNTAVNNGGTHALYISNSPTTTPPPYTYTVSGAERVYAAKLLHFENGKYAFTFDWECYGESSSYDYLSVGLLPATATITADNTNSGTLPTGWIALHDQQYLLGQTTWQTVPEKYLQMTAGNYYLVLRWRQDASGPSGTIQPAAVDNVSIVKLACPYDVTGLAVATDPAVTETTATVTWTAGDATQWQVAYSTNSTFEGATEEIVSTASYNMTGLTANTQYYVKVRAYCGGEDYGSWCNAISFYTDCPQYTTIPAEGWTINFDDMTGTTSGSTNNLPRCWNYINECGNTSYQGYPVVYNSSNYSNSPNNHLRFYSYLYYNGSSTTTSDPKPQYAILPQMQDVNGLRLKLYARAGSTGTNYNASFKVGIMSDPADASTFELIDTKTPTSTTYEPFVIPFNNYSGTGTYIAIMIDAAEGAANAYASYYHYVCIDDITVEEIPSCMDPTGLDADNITSTTADLSWTAGGSETAWDIFLTDNPFAQPASYTLPTVTGTTTNPHTLTELTPATRYYVYVRARCSASNQSPWSDAYEFVTECDARTIDAEHPYIENFNDYTPGSTGSSDPTNYPNDELPLCWKFLNRSETSGTYPMVFLSSYDSYAVSGNCLFFKSSSTTPIYAILPEFTNDISGLALSFTYRNESTTASNGTLYVSYMTDPTDASTFNNDAAVACEITTTKTPKEVLFANAPAGSYFAFKYQGGSSNNMYLSIDDVTVKVPVFVTANQIVNTVSDPATEMTWNEFVSHWNNGDHFTSTTFTLMDDINVSTMVGSSEKPFTGTFDGSSHTITANLTATDNNFTAPFRIIKNATIQNLKVDGTINDGGFKFCAGFAGDCYGNNTFTNCVSDVTINATIEGDGTHGGFIARNHGGSATGDNLCTTTFNGCAFTGQLLGSSTNQCGGFCGWSEYNSPNYAKTIFNSCLFAPQVVTMSTTSSAAFARRRNASYVNFNNCYFMQDFNDGTNNTAQGKQAYTITGVDPVYVAFSGEHTLYNMSGIDAYAVGLKYGNAKIAGEGDEVTLALDGAAGYEANHGTLTANGETFTLTMEAYDTEISGVSCPVPYNVAVPAANLTASSAQVTWNGGSDSYTLQYREVITAPVDEDVTYDFEDGTQGWTTIDADGHGDAWSRNTSGGYGSNNCMRAKYNSTYAHQDYLVSPQITLGGSLSFYAKQESTSYSDSFRVYLSTSGNSASDFTIELTDGNVTPTTTYAPYTYDLSSYSGMGYVAIVYTAAANQYYLYIDDIKITATIAGEYGEWQTVNDAVSPQPLSTLTPETTYQVQVKGNCAGVETDYSDVMEFTTPATCPAPTALAVTEGSVTAHEATITWTENGEATTWTVEYADNADFTGALTETVEDEATYSFDELDGETTYYVRVKADCDVDDQSQPSNVVNFTTLVACPVPTVLTVTEITTTSAKLSWTENGTATAWQICLNGDETNLIPANSNPFVLDEGLTASTSYTVKVRANCGGIDGESGWSNEVSFATECDVITITAATPYRQDFDTPVVTTTYGQIGEMPVCWENYPVNVAASAKILAEDVTYNYADEGQVLYFYGSGNNYAVLPEFTNALNTLQISFKYATESDSYGTLTLGFITEADENFNTFEPISPITIYNASSASDDTFVDVDPISLQSLPANATRLVFRWYYSGQWGCNVDDVEVSLRAIPSFTKTIAAVGEENWEGGRGGYYLIASPLDASVSPAEVGMITDEEGSDEITYDLYSFNQAQDLEWQNYRASNFNIVGGQGYLYASKYGTTLTFTGDPTISDACSVELFKTDNTNVGFQGWNLVGNPFGEDAYINKPFYTLENSDTYTSNEASTAIHAMQGLFVVADEDGEMLTFRTEAPGKSAKLNMNLRSDNKQLDNAILVFGGEQQLGKMTFRENSSKIYMPVEGKEYAVATAEGNVGEMPVSFKAEKNGSYTLSFTSEEVTFSYLHLIDNMTGNDVNLLETPSYTFDARTSDYESRFRLVFATGTSVDNNTFGFVNAMGNFCIFGIEGEATVQVIDMLGHVISSETFSGSYERKINGAPGVYLVRLINGDNVMVQKIVVR